MNDEKLERALSQRDEAFESYLEYRDAFHVLLGVMLRHGMGQNDIGDDHGASWLDARLSECAAKDPK